MSSNKITKVLECYQKVYLVINTPHRGEPGSAAPTTNVLYTNVMYINLYS